MLFGQKTCKRACVHLLFFRARMRYITKYVGLQDGFWVGPATFDHECASRSWLSPPTIGKTCIETIVFPLTLLALHTLGDEKVGLWSSEYDTGVAVKGRFYLGLGSNLHNDV
jgi:hypothetical protein